METFLRQIVALALLTVLAACDSSPDLYTLYRSSVTAPTARLHVATFDANEPGSYNQENCFNAAKLFEQQHGVSVKFWCEKGRFHK